ncbi:phage terminase small subunit P27 family [Dysosmobacter acutus]|uniref:phage terminase small subunit P27 family n=1 Tax=Dysosmobacter acutus TaxID=2841504 RepID=UPI001F4C6E54|nr:phage terminase small subunit P27 family [Dysosmobacter acutus]
MELIEFKGKKHLTKAEKEIRKKTEVKARADGICAPDYLTDEQKREFDRIAGELKSIGIMSNLDCGTLGMYLRMLDRYKALDEKLNDPELMDDIFAYEKTFKLWDRAISQCQSLAKSLGMTIDSRCKLVVPQKEEEPRRNKFAVVENG